MNLPFTLLGRTQTQKAENEQAVLPVDAWLNRYAIFEDGTIFTTQAYANYRKYCAQHNLMAETSLTFERKVADFGVEKKLTNAGYVYTVKLL